MCTYVSCISIYIYVYIYMYIYICIYIYIYSLPPNIKRPPPNIETARKGLNRTCEEWSQNHPRSSQPRSPAPVAAYGITNHPEATASMRSFILLYVLQYLLYKILIENPFRYKKKLENQRDL